MGASWQVTAELSNLEPIRNFIGENAAKLGVDSPAVEDMLLAVTELVTNTIEHGYQHQRGSIQIDVDRTADSLIVRLRDQSPPFDPTTVPPPDLTVPLDQRPLGGLGIYLTMQIMDEVKYCLTPESDNEITLIKKINSRRGH